MIASVRGEVLVRRPDHVVIESAGVGYRLTVSAETLKAVPASGKEATLHAHLVARDDSMQLYGFACEEERDLFLHLTSVSGDRPEGRDRDPLRRHPARAAARDRRRRREALPGRARDRQADLRAGDRRAAREGRRRARRGRAGARGRGRRRPALARPRRPRRTSATPLAEAEKLLERREGETPEELIGAALRGAGTQGGRVSVSRDPSIGGGGLDDPIATEPIAEARAGRATRSSTARCARGGSPTSSTRSR